MNQRKKENEFVHFPTVTFFSFLSSSVASPQRGTHVAPPLIKKLTLPSQEHAQEASSPHLETWAPNHEHLRTPLATSPLVLYGPYLLGDGGKFVCRSRDWRAPLVAHGVADASQRW